MATINKQPHSTGKYSIVSEIYAWIIAKISSYSKVSHEHEITSYYECEEYNRNRIRDEANARINRAKYIARRSW